MKLLKKKKKKGWGNQSKQTCIMTKMILIYNFFSKLQGLYFWNFIYSLGKKFLELFNRILKILLK